MLNAVDDARTVLRAEAVHTAPTPWRSMSSLNKVLFVVAIVAVVAVLVFVPILSLQQSQSNSTLLDRTARDDTTIITNQQKVLDMLHAQIENQEVICTATPGCNIHDLNRASSP